MPTWSNDMEAIAYAVYAKGLAHEGIGEERLAADVDRWCHLTAAEPSAG